MSLRTTPSGGMSASAMPVSLNSLPALAKQQIPHAQLPALYLAARTALHACCQLDEVQEVQNKHAAIAVYAKQAKDRTLLNYAKRIRLRAYERIGELLGALPGYNEVKQACAQNGLAMGIASQAMKMVMIPPRVRDTMIDSESPPTMQDMAARGPQYGAKPRHWAERVSAFHTHTRREDRLKPTAHSACRELMDRLGATVVGLDVCLLQGRGKRFSIAAVSREVPAEDVIYVRRQIQDIRDFLDELESGLPDTNAAPS